MMRSEDFRRVWFVPVEGENDRAGKEKFQTPEKIGEMTEEESALPGTFRKIPSNRR